MGNQVTIQCGAATDRGRKRALNEDSVLTAWPIFAVADGMGGHEAGEVASHLAVTTLAELLAGHESTPDDLREAVTEAGQRIAAIPTTQKGGQAGTTLTGIMFVTAADEPYWLVFNLGDSRTYRLLEGNLTQISIDHSEIQQKIDQGLLTPEQARTAAHRNVVTKALGAGLHIDPDCWLLPVEPADRFLMCSDGLSGELSDLQIKSILLAHPDPTKAAEMLVAEAVNAGGHDNVSAVVVDAVLVPSHRGSTTTHPISEPADETNEADDDDTIPHHTNRKVALP